MRTGADHILTPQHRTLRLIATSAGILAYLALVLFTLQAVGNLLLALNQDRLNQVNLLLLQESPALRYLNLAVTFISQMVNGVIFWVLLTGLSLGLRMIVETDVNYRTRVEEASSD